MWPCYVQVPRWRLIAQHRVWRHVVEGVELVLNNNDSGGSFLPMEVAMAIGSGTFESVKYAFSSDDYEIAAKVKPEPPSGTLYTIP